MSESQPFIKIDDIHLGRVIYRMKPKGVVWRKSYHRKLWELSVTWAGGCDIVLDDRTLVVNAGQATLVSPHTAHASEIKHEQGCLAQTIHFELDWPALNQLANRVLTVSPRVQAHLRDLLDVQDTGVLPETRRKAILALILMEMVHPTNPQVLPCQFLSRTDDVLVMSVLNVLREDLREGIRMDRLCEVTGYSASRLRALFRATMNMSLTEAMLILRLEEAQRLLRYSGLKIGVISQMTGFKQPSKFTRFFRARTGMTPREYAGTHAPLGVAWLGVSQDLNNDDIPIKD